LKNIENDSAVMDGIDQAAAAIRSGKVVAIPTETYYGLAVDPDNESALEALFSIKGRPSHKPILLLISNTEQLSRYASAVPKQYEPLMARHWPGPLTLVFPAKSTVSTLLTGGTGTIGIRLTPHPVTLRLIETLGKPITATSANLSDGEPALSIGEVLRIFGGRLGAVVDGGEADGGPGSTVINLIDGQLCIERFGRVKVPDLPPCRRH
jgi:L-threonylcarbamoyladenylate synthase